jgi:hypothetical protein
MKQINKFCKPALLYLYISFFALLFLLFQKVNFLTILMKAFFVIFWTFLLNALCNNGYKSVSWFLVLLPYVIMLATYFMTFFNIEEGFYTQSTNLEKSAAIAQATSQNAQSDLKKTMSLATMREDEAKALESQLNAKKVEVTFLKAKANALEQPASKAAAEAQIANERLNAAREADLKQQSFALATGYK